MFAILFERSPSPLFARQFPEQHPSSPELEFFTSLANCRALKKLCLDNNLFSVILPQSIGNLTRNLTELIMDNNKQEGNIPSELGNLIDGNNLSGAVTATVASMRNLQKLDLFSNKLNGSVSVDKCYARSISESLEKIVPGQQLIQWHPSTIHRKSHKYSN
ncbi:hypothetical protein Tsubulata_042910 [Turnera subulata]|uniref:Uncharacterized protein n=1 Tax=Turnera subulata TaxID=218843 RepID=A0A9Q0GLG7_9ROSI|nr:hypothetical protein Tsubulata_042910 [Turnera subulata]